NVITLDYTGLTDAAGNAGTGTATSGNYAVDTVAPMLDGAHSTPADNATGVAVADNIVIDFSENIAFGSSGTITLRNVTDNSTTASFTIASGAVGTPTGGTASISNDKLTINPTADLLAGKAYSVQFTAGSLTDTAGNALAAIADDTTYNFSTSVPNAVPTLTSFAAAVATTLEDTQEEITLDYLKAQGNEVDSDGTVDAFVVQTVSTGSLKIGTSALTATAWDATTNNTVDATNKAYWTPAGNASGNALNAFTVKAKDNGGAVSATAVQVTVNVTEVNDAPSLNANGSTPTFTEDGSAVTLFNSANASTNEAGQTLSGLTLTVTNVTDGASERLGIDGSIINLTNGTSGTTATNGMTYSVSMASGTATVTVTKAAGISETAMVTLVEGMTYSNTSQAPSTASTRVVTLTSVQDNGGTANGGLDTATPGGTQPVAVTVTAVNDAPTNISLSATTIAQTDGVNAVVGTLTTADVDTGDTHTYSLVAGNGTNDAHNSSFNINGGTLRANNAGALAIGNYNVMVRTTDNGTGNLTYDKAFTITVADTIVTTQLDTNDDTTFAASLAADIA
ncbi:MAG TPA: Ig-like domain-containing protein, partial [Burkholderiaceae bacterium]|nr:Ig-like domain-containing protein [Burkholderiaceae bacterium]